MSPLPTISTLFPYTTLFRSKLHSNNQSRIRCNPSQRHPPSHNNPSPSISLNSQDNHTRARPYTLLHTRDSLDGQDRKSTRLNSSHANISYAVFCLKNKKHLY